MTRICMDTSAYSHFKRNLPEVVQVVTAAREVCIPAVVLGELRTGFRLGRRSQQDEIELRSFLANPVVRVLDVNEEASVHYADLMVDLRRAGTPLPTNDVWVAALALREGATVITYDDHFGKVRRIGALILRRN